MHAAGHALVAVTRPKGKHGTKHVMSHGRLKTSKLASAELFAKGSIQLWPAAVNPGHHTNSLHLFTRAQESAEAKHEEEQEPLLVDSDSDTCFWPIQPTGASSTAMHAAGHALVAVTRLKVKHGQRHVIHA